MKFYYMVLLVLIGGMSSWGQAEAICEAKTETSVSLNGININTASIDELSSKLKGIGKTKAAAIVEWRKTNGKFETLEDVDEVKGIGAATLEKNKALIRFKD